MHGHEDCLRCGHVDSLHADTEFKNSLLTDCGVPDCPCEQFESPKSPWADAEARRENAAAVKVEDAPEKEFTATLVAMTEEQRAAHVEFRDAAKEARAAQVAAQAAAQRYAQAVRVLSEVFGGDGGPQ